MRRLVMQKLPRQVDPASSSINGMVYVGGDRSDYSRWAGRR